MKKNSLIAKTLGIFAVALSLASCGDQNEVFQKYLDQGEHIYISIADSLTVLPGNQRAVVKWKVDADPKLKDCVVKYSDTDSVIVPIGNPGEQWLSTTISPIPEGEVDFTAYTRDIYGNNSLASETTKKVYGPDYLSELLNPTLSGVEASAPDHVKITWESMTGCVGVNLTYTNKNNEQVTRFVEGTEIVLADAQLGTSFSYTSSFVPTEECVDTFETTETSIGQFPEGIMLDRSNWTITASSDATHKNDGGKPEVLLDDNYNTYWHSSWSPDEPLPHWVLIDMQQVCSVAEIQVYKRVGNTDCKKVELYLSEDNEHFTHVGDIEYEKMATPNGKSLNLTDAVKGRYLKCVITESYRPPYVSLSEIKVVGK